MMKKCNILVFTILFLMQSLAFASSSSPKEAISGLLKEVKTLGTKEPARDELKALAGKLAAHIDENELKNRLLSDVPQLTQEQKNELLGLVEVQLTAALVGALKKQDGQDLPLKELVKDDNIELIFTQKKDEKEQEVVLLFAKKSDSYLLKDVLAGKKSLLTVYQRQMKKLFKKHTYAEVVERLSAERQ